jgi:hypothetical protein
MLIKFNYQIVLIISVPLTIRDFPIPSLFSITLGLLKSKTSAYYTFDNPRISLLV